MKELNLSVSEDGRIVELLESKDEGAVRARIQVPFKHDVHFDYFFSTLMNGNGQVIADFRSRAARFGLDLKIIGEGNEAFFPDEDSKSIFFKAEIKPFMYDFLPQGEDWRQIVGYIGWNPGKLVAVRDDRVVTRGELIDRLTRGNVRLMKGSQVCLDGSVSLALASKRYYPVKSRITASSLISLLGDDVPRQKLTQYQQTGDDEAVVTPANGGVITYTMVRPHEYSLLISHNQENGVRHAQAMHVSPYSAAILHIELKGNGKNDVTLDHVVARFYRDERRYLRPIFTAPNLSLLAEKKPSSAPYNPKVEIFKFIEGIRPDLGAIVPFMEVDTANDADLVGLGKKVRELPNLGQESKYTFYFNTFPPRSVAQVFTDPERRSKIGAIIFSTPPVGNETFTSEDYSMIRHFDECGIDILWDHPSLGRLYFHKVGFMRDPKERRFYDEAYSSHGIASCFGSSSICTEVDKSNIKAAIEGFARFTGGKGYIFNGGGPAMMTEFSRTAREYSLRVGTINLVKAEEEQAETPDVFIPFGEDDLNTRQAAMIDSSAVFMVFEGGLGTLFELYECATKNKIDRQGRPIFIIGNSAFQREAYEQIKRGIETGKIPKHILSSVHHIRSSSEVYAALMNHYNFEDVAKF